MPESEEGIEERTLLGPDGPIDRHIRSASSSIGSEPTASANVNLLICAQVERKTNQKKDYLFCLRSTITMVGSSLLVASGETTYVCLCIVAYIETLFDDVCAIHLKDSRRV